MLQSSNIPETDYSEYSAATTYDKGDRVIILSEHRIYESLQDANTGNTPATSPTWWLDCGATNRWRPFDLSIQNQAQQDGNLNWALMPGLVDSIALLNLDAIEVEITVSDTNANLVSNGDDWTGATGTTPPTNWSAVGTPSDFTVDSGALKMTVDAAIEGIGQTISVAAGTKMHLSGIYKNAAGSIAQYAVYDLTHSLDIIAPTDLPPSEVYSTMNCVFTVPDGCTSVRVSLLAKNASNVVWFDKIVLSEILYNTTINLINNSYVYDWYTYFFEPVIMTNNVVKSDLPPYTGALIAVNVKYPDAIAKCGEIVFGKKFFIGKTLFGPEVGIIDYSTKEADTFGNFYIVERAYSNRASIDFITEKLLSQAVEQELAKYRSKPLVYVGSENYPSLIIYGFYRNFNTVISYPKYNECSIDLEGLT